MFVADLLVLVWCLRQDASEEVADSSKKEGVATDLLPLLTHQQIIGVLTLYRESNQNINFVVIV